jgi:hypothetical protein
VLAQQRVDACYGRQGLRRRPEAARTGSCTRSSRGAPASPAAAARCSASRTEARSCSGTRTGSSASCTSCTTARTSG